MSYISINEHACIGCGACVADCIRENLVLRGGTARVKGNCFLCSHCIAICPKSAVSVQHMDYQMEDVLEYCPEQFHIEPDHMLNAIKYRRSVRQFKSQPIKQEIMQAIISAGQYSETAGNRQNTRFTVIQDRLAALKPIVWRRWHQMLSEDIPSLRAYGARPREMYERWMKNPADDTLFFHAPALLIVSTPNMIDAGIAIANMEHVAQSYGAGMVIMGFLQYAISSSQEAKQFLGLEHQSVAACVLMGYPAVRYHRTVPRATMKLQWL